MQPLLFLEILFKYFNTGFILAKSFCSFPFSIHIFSADPLFIEILVVEIKESTVNEMELMAGLFEMVSALPQYLMRAKFGCAIAVTSDNLILL